MHRNQKPTQVAKYFSGTLASVSSVGLPQITCYNRARMAGEEFSKHRQCQTCLSGSKTPRYAQSHPMSVKDKKLDNLKTASASRGRQPHQLELPQVICVPELQADDFHHCLPTKERGALISKQGPGELCNG